MYSQNYSIILSGTLYGLLKGISGWYSRRYSVRYSVRYSAWYLFYMALTFGNYIQGGMLYGVVVWAIFYVPEFRHRNPISCNLIVNCQTLRSS